MISKEYLTIFNKFKISKGDKERYTTIINSAESFDDIEFIINDFMNKYVSVMNKQIYNLIYDTLTISLSEGLLAKEYAVLENVFVLSSSNYENILKTNYAVIAGMVVKKELGLLSVNEPAIEKMLAEKLIGEYEKRIGGAMANTRTDVLLHVRNLQREMIIRNQQLFQMKKDGVIDEIIEKEKALFRENMLKKYPQLKKMLDDGSVLKSRSWKDKDGNEKFRSYTLDEYNEMATSETLKNIDRDAVEIISQYYNEPVVEFYLRDSRAVENPNDACEHIMSKTVFGKHLLATSEYISRLLEVWSISKAKAEHSMEISRHCRHSIKRCDDEFLNKINKIINISKMTDQE